MAEVQGRVRFVTETVDVSKKDQPFLTRSVCVTSEADVNGTIYEQHTPIQAKQDKCKLLDDVNIGDEVIATYGISGTVSKNDRLEPTKNNPNSETGFVNLNLIRIQVISKAGAAPAPSTTTAPAAAGAAAGSDDLPF